MDTKVIFSSVDLVVTSEARTCIMDLFVYSQGDDKAVRRRITEFGWSFPHLIESYLGGRNASSDNGHSASRDSFAMFQNATSHGIPLPDVPFWEACLRDFATEHEQSERNREKTADGLLDLSTGTDTYGIDPAPPNVAVPVNADQVFNDVNLNITSEGDDAMVL